MQTAARLTAWIIAIGLFSITSQAWAGECKEKLSTCLDAPDDGNSISEIQAKGFQGAAALVQALRDQSQVCQEVERTCSAESAPDQENGSLSPAAKEALAGLYKVRAIREKLDRLLVHARNELRIEASRCRYGYATANVDTPSTCTLPSSSDGLDELLGRFNPLDAASVLAATEQIKAVGGGQVPAPVAELLSLTTEIAVKKAKRNGLELLEARLAQTVCELELPDTPGSDKTVKVFPATCRLLGDVSLEELAADPRRLQPALSEDLITLGIDRLFGENLQGLGGTAPDDVKAKLGLVKGTIVLALKTIHRVRGQQQSRPSHIDAQALVGDLLRLRCSATKGCDTTWSTAGEKAIPLALEAMVEYVAREGKVNIATILDDLLPTADANTRARAIELALLGLRALGLAREPAPGDEHDTWYAAVSLVFEITETVLAGQAAERDNLRKLRALVDGITDENTPAAISAGAELVTSIIGACEDPAPKTQSKEDPLAKCAKSRKLETATRLLSGIASYAVTYSSAAQTGKTEAELRASRKDALEGMIDAVTRRTHRHGDWVFSLGIPIGFTTGAQFLRTRNFVDTRECVLGSGKSYFRSPGKCNTQVMPPQLEVPLGFALQRLVGRRYSKGHVNREKLEKLHFDGFHAFVSLIDLGQFLAYDQQGKLNEPRWSTLFSPGLQLGWAVGTPTNMFVLGPEVRYAPTLFQDTRQVEASGGALRIGLSLSYYVSLFDFN